MSVFAEAFTTGRLEPTANPASTIVRGRVTTVKTVVTRSPIEAAEYLRNGEVVAFPTETVYGLGANAFDAVAVAKIFEAKERPADNPLIVHVGSKDDVRLVARDVPPLASRLIEAFFPGPLTLVLPRRTNIPDIVTAGLDTVGVRMPRHPVALDLLHAAGFPLCAPSANRSGRPSPTTWKAVLEDLDGRIACVLEGEATEIGIESTVVDATGPELVVLRSGGLGLEAIAQLAPVRMAVEADAGERSPVSPGMKYRHYAPVARVVPIGDSRLARAGRDAAFIGLHTPQQPESFARCRVLPDVGSYARALFAFFRECDAAGVTSIWAELPPPDGIGAALRDRIERASHAEMHQNRER
ncbi:MAG: L-threonylcarbamoyladenylate synthase [Blastocatellia bacterium]